MNEFNSINIRKQGICWKGVKSQHFLELGN